MISQERTQQELERARQLLLERGELVTDVHGRTWRIHTARIAPCGIALIRGYPQLPGVTHRGNASFYVVTPAIAEFLQANSRRAHVRQLLGIGDAKTLKRLRREAGCDAFFEARDVWWESRAQDLARLRTVDFIALHGVDYLSYNGAALSRGTVYAARCRLIRTY